jgi:glyoxylase-like metal-dependent hydrolase (beta-lactamase superfamily II)
VPDLYLRQLKLGPMDNFVYLVGARDAKEVAVIDPAWDVAAIEQAAREDGKTIVCAAVSHCHKDHINGVPELLSRHDVPVYAQKEELAFSEDLRAMNVSALEPGDTFSVGPLRLKALHTPGHTPGSQCFHVDDALVSGDTLFINGCGRCDLRGGNPEDMYRTISQVLAKLPDGTKLLPGHDYADVPVDSLANVKAKNPYFQLHDLASFVAFRMRPRK